MKNSTVFIILLSLLLAFILQTLGFILSIHKPLWRDEINTQTYTINESYTDILLGKDKMEGNVAPLFISSKKHSVIFVISKPPAMASGGLGLH